jgi:hypothetical protein
MPHWRRSPGNVRPGIFYLACLRQIPPQLPKVVQYCQLLGHGYKLCGSMMILVALLSSSNQPGFPQRSRFGEMIDIPTLTTLTRH